MHSILLCDFFGYTVYSCVFLCFLSLGYTVDWAQDPKRLLISNSFWGYRAAASLCHSVDSDTVFKNTSVCSGAPWNYTSVHQ